MIEFVISGQQLLIALTAQIRQFIEVHAAPLTAADVLNRAGEASAAGDPNEDRRRVVGKRHPGHAAPVLNSQKTSVQPKLRQAKRFNTPENASFAATAAEGRTKYRC
jgi:hypothetical protein